MAVAFVVASPFVVLDAPHFLTDFRRQSQIMDRGWLGFEHVGNGFWYNVTPNLTGAIGVVLVVLGVAGLGWALGGARARTSWSRPTSSSTSSTSGPGRSSPTATCW